MWASLTTSMNYYAFATVYNSCGHRTLYRASETNYTKKWIEPKNTVMKEEPLPPAMVEDVSFWIGHLESRKPTTNHT